MTTDNELADRFEWLRRNRHLTVAEALDAFDADTWRDGTPRQRPMWCNVHDQLEYGPGGPIGPDDHRPYPTAAAVTTSQHSDGSVATTKGGQ